MTSLYEILGVERTATLDDIKAVHRRLANICHPDKGGDAERFNAVQRAYKVLSDAAKRAAYDATGAFNDNPANDLSAPIGLIHTFFDMVLKEFIQSNFNPQKDPRNFDMVEHFCARMAREIANLEDQITKNNQVFDLITDVNARFSTAGEESFLKRSLEAKVEQGRKSLTMLATKVKDCQRAIELMRTHQYRFDQVMMPILNFQDYGASTAWTNS